MKTRLARDGHRPTRRLDDRFACRRLCTAGVVTVIASAGRALRAGRLRPAGLGRPEAREYESALTRFEARDFGGAAQILGNLLPAHQADGPTLVLLSRVVDCLIEEPAVFDPVWRLTGK